MRMLLRNSVWRTATICTVCEQSIVVGFIAYIGKYMQVTFGVEITTATRNTGAHRIEANYCTLLYSTLLYSTLVCCSLYSNIPLFAAFPSLAPHARCIFNALSCTLPRDNLRVLDVPNISKHCQY